jgi:hypothetical protein
MALEWDESIPDEESDGSPPKGHTVISPNGIPLQVLSAAEASFYTKIRDAILEAYTFTDPSDMADLDRILLCELTIYRINNNISTNTSDLGMPLSGMDQRRLHQSIKELSAQLAKDKDALGISKTAREKDSAETVAGYLDNLRKRAGEFCVTRNAQAQMSIALLQEVISIADTFLRSNELERSKLGMQEPEDVLRWIVDEVASKYDEIDQEFVQTQRYWVEGI